MWRFLKLFPQAIRLARIAESAVPMSGHGTAKLAFALDVAAAVYETEEALRSSWKSKPAYLEALGAAIGTAVRLFNAAGVFKKSAL